MNNLEFVAKWKDSLLGPAKPHDGRIYTEKWASNGNGSYIDLIDAPEHWFTEIDTFLEAVKAKSPNMLIAQIKVKFGGVRVYLMNMAEEFLPELYALEKRLYNEDLI